MPPRKADKQTTKKTKTRTNRSTKAASNEVTEASAKEENPGKDTKEAENAIEVNWTDDLTWKLINLLDQPESDSLRKALFPQAKKGGNSSLSQGGSKSKSDYHWHLAYILFSKEKEFADAIEKAKSSEKANLRKAWGLKVKNRLQRLVENTRSIMDEMGATGAGLTSAEEVDMSLTGSHITSCWSRVKDKQPWFWDMKKIMLNRPNVSKIGVGNNTSGYDTSILLGEVSGTQTPVNNTPGGEGTDSGSNSGANRHRTSGDIPHENTSEGVTTSSNGFWGPSSAGNETDAEGEDDDAEGDGTNSEGEYNIAQRKRKTNDKQLNTQTAKKSRAASPAPSAKKTAPRPAKSTPSTTTSQSNKRKSGLEKFADITAREEETAQKYLELRKVKAEARAARSLEKVRSKKEIQMNKDKLKAELAQKRLELEFQLRGGRQLSMQEAPANGIWDWNAPAALQVPHIQLNQPQHEAHVMAPHTPVQHHKQQPIGVNQHQPIINLHQDVQHIEEPSFTEQLNNNDMDYNNLYSNT